MWLYTLAMHEPRGQHVAAPTAAAGAVDDGLLAPLDTFAEEGEYALKILGAGEAVVPDGGVKNLA